MKHTKRICLALAMMLCAATLLIGCRKETPPPPAETTEAETNTRGEVDTKGEAQTEPETLPESDTHGEVGTRGEEPTDPETIPETEPETVPQCLEYELMKDGTYAVVGIGTWRDAELIIPAEYNGSPVVKIDMNTEGFLHAAHVTSMTIPASVTEIKGTRFSPSLTEIIVDEENPYFASYGGLLYNKELTDLVYCPRGSSSKHNRHIVCGLCLLFLYFNNVSSFPTEA